MGWRRVLFGVNADDLDEQAPDNKPWRDIASGITVPLFVAAVAFGGSWLGANISSSDNDRSIQAERDHAIEQFRRDQRQEHYAEIRQQATRLENAGSFSATAVTLGLRGAAAGMREAVFPPTQPPTGDVAEAVEQFGTPLPYSYNGDYYNNTYSGLGKIRDSWQDAYTGLDQAISNAEIAGSVGAINIARALRDRYRNDYRASIRRNVDTVIAEFSDSKLNPDELTNSLVGVPDETLKATYPREYLDKSTDDLTTMYVEAAKADLQLNDR